MQHRRMPCKARSVPDNHNAETAFFEIPSDIEHGRILVCSHPQCASSGRRFRFCKFCDLPVAKRNFLRRHSHGQTQPSKDENSKRSDNEDEDDDSSEISGKKRARGDEQSPTPTQFDYDQKQNPPYDHGDNTDEDSRARKIRTERLSSNDAQPMGTFDAAVHSPPSIQSKVHHFGSIMCREIKSSTSQREAVGEPQAQQKKDPNMDPSARWEEAVPPSPVASRASRGQSRPNSRQQDFYLPQKKHHMYRRHQISTFPGPEPRQGGHRGERTTFPDQESRQSGRSSERNPASTTAFEFDQSEQQSRQPTEPETTVMNLTPRECHWLSLLHSRPPTSDVDSMRRWMDNVLHTSAVHSDVTSPHRTYQRTTSRHHQDLRIETPPPSNANQDDFEMQRVPRTPPPPSYHHQTSSNLSTGSRDISPILGPRRHHSDPESNFHTSSSSRSHDSPYVFGTYGNDDHMEAYWRMM